MHLNSDGVMLQGCDDDSQSFEINLACWSGAAFCFSSPLGGGLQGSSKVSSKVGSCTITSIAIRYSPDTAAVVEERF